MIRQVGNSQTTSLGPFRKSEYSLTSFYSKTLFDCGGQLRRVAEELIDGRRFVREIGFCFYRSAPVRVDEKPTIRPSGCFPVGERIADLSLIEIAAGIT